MSDFISQHFSLQGLNSPIQKEVFVCTERLNNKLLTITFRLHRSQGTMSEYSILHPVGEM